MLSIKFGWNIEIDQKWGSSSLLKILKSQILLSASNDPKLNSKWPDTKGPYICSSLRTANTKFSSILLRKYCYNFPIDSYVKFQSAKTLFLAARRKMYNFIFPYVCIIYHKLWLRSYKNCRSSVLKSQIPLGPVLTKLSKCHKICNFWQITKTTLYSPMTTLFIMKFGSDRIKTRSSV